MFGPCVLQPLRQLQHLPARFALHLEATQVPERWAVHPKEQESVEQRYANWVDNDHDCGVKGHPGMIRGVAIDRKVNAQKAGLVRVFVECVTLEGSKYLGGGGWKNQVDHCKVELKNSKNLRVIWAQNHDQELVLLLRAIQII